MTRHLAIGFAAGQLTVVLTGDREPLIGNSTDEAVESWRAIRHASSDHGADRILVIDRLTGPASTPRTVAVGRSIRADRSATKVLCALVVEDEDVRKNVLLGARMATERGAQTRVFATVEEAQAWLDRSNPLGAAPDGAAEDPPGR